MLSWSIEKIVLPLKYSWKISRNESISKTNLVVTVREGSVAGKGEAAPNVRYDETPDKLLQEFDQVRALLPAGIDSPGSCSRILDALRLSKALRFALESAYIHLLSSRRQLPVYQLLDLAEPLPARTAFTIPMMEIGKMKSFYHEHSLRRFGYIKLKVGMEDADDVISYMATFCDQPMMIDANEAFTDVEACIRLLEKFRSARIEFVEQPMPASMKEESLHLKKYSPFPLIADESITWDPDFDHLEKAFHGVNMKLMKAGGYLNGIRILKEARRRKMKTMIGCMVETTLGISSALNLASLCDYTDLDSFLILKEEPFGIVEEKDGKICQRNP